MDVRLPDGTVVKNVPDGMTQTELMAAIEGESTSPSFQPGPNGERFPLPSQLAAAGMTGSLQGEPVRFPASDFLNPIAGLAETGVQVGSSLIGTPLAGVEGIIRGIAPGGQTAAEGVESGLDRFTFQPRSESGQLISGALGKAGAGVDQIVSDLAFATGNEDQAFGAAAVKTALLGAPSVLLGRGLIGNTVKAPIRAPLPTTQELFQQGGAAFTRARQSGGGVSGNAKGLGSSVGNLTDSNGLKLNFNKKLHPDSSAARKEILKRTEGEVEITFDDLMELRELAGDAAGSVKPADAFRGRALRDAIDDHIESIANADTTGVGSIARQNLQEGLANWRAARKSEVIDRAFERAKNSSQNQTQAGLENALRNEFRSIANNDRKFKQFTKEEQAAILKVVRGGSVDNLLKFLGKFSPKGVISGGIVPAAITSVLGPIPAIGVAAGGFAAKNAALRRSLSNADRVSELVRTVGPFNE